MMWILIMYLSYHLGVSRSLDFFVSEYLTSNIVEGCCCSNLLEEHQGNLCSVKVIVWKDIVSLFLFYIWIQEEIWKNDLFLSFLCHNFYSYFQIFVQNDELEWWGICENSNTFSEALR